MPPQCLLPVDQSDNNVSIAVPSLPPVIPAEGPTPSEFAVAASMQQERSTIESDVVVSASATTAIQGRKRPAFDIGAPKYVPTIY
eukprot:4899643-Ditylum_brightwellii.AAC.1